MPTFEKLQLADAPKPPQERRSEKIQPYVDFISSLTEGEVGKAEPREDETVKTIRGWLRRASRSLRKEVAVWETEGAVFFRPEGERDESRERRERHRHSRSEKSQSSGRRRSRR